jgi:hypothetical protein
MYNPNAETALESVRKFIEDSLTLATQMPDSVDNFESQAFGALEFVNKQYPELSPELEKMWNGLDGYWGKFWRISMES